MFPNIVSASLRFALRPELTILLFCFILNFSSTFAFQININLRPTVVAPSTLGRLVQPKEEYSRLSSALRVTAVAGADAAVAAYDWSFLDAVYLITCPNADPGSERLNRAREILAEVDLLDKVVVKEFDTDDEDRIRGCYASHLSVMKDALRERNQQSNSKGTNWLQSFLPSDVSTTKDSDDSNDFKVLILEDNIACSGGLKQATIDGVAEYSKSNTGWDVIQLSYIPYVPNLSVTRTDRDKIVKLNVGVGSALGTTAYVINKAGMEAMIQQDEKRGFYAPIPDVMAELFPESRFAAFPTPFVRAPTTKSLVNPQLDDLRTVLFQPGVASQVQRVLAFSGISTNALLPITVILLLLSTVASGRSTALTIWSLLTTGSLDGPILLAFLSTCFTVFSLGILVKGAMLAPKPPATDESE